MSDSPTRTRWLIVALVFCMGVLMFIDRETIVPTNKSLTASAI